MGFKELGITPAEFVNQVNDMMPKAYQSDLPASEAGQTDFTGVGKVLQKSKEFASAWHTNAITLVSELLFRKNKIVNPMAEFYSDEVVETGDKIVESIIDTAASFAFNPSKAEKKLFERRPAALKQVVHTAVRDVSTPLTLQDTEFTKIFRNVNELNEYVVAVTESLVSGNEAEKYYTAKKTISEAARLGLIRTIDLNQDGATIGIKDVQKAISGISKLMIHPSRAWNMGNVGQDGNNGETGINIQADYSQLRLILPVTTSVDLDIDFFATVFHLDAVKSNLAIKEIDFFPDIYEYTADHAVTAEDVANGFADGYNFEAGDTMPKGSQATAGAYEASLAEGGLKDIAKVFDASRIRAVILDKRSLVFKPQLPMQLSSEANPLGRYTNIFLNEKEFYSFSPFMPSAIIMADDPSDATAFIRQLLVDSKNVVNDSGVANLKYTDETDQALDEILPAETEVTEEIDVSETKKAAAKKSNKKATSKKTEE